MAPEYYDDDPDDEDDGVDYTKPPPLGKKAAPSDQSRTSTPIATKSMLKNPTLRASIEASDADPRASIDGRNCVPDPAGNGGERTDEVGGDEDIVVEAGAEDREEQEEKQEWERQMEELERESEEKGIQTKKLKELIEKKAWRRKEALRKRKEENEKKVALARVKY